MSYWVKNGQGSIILRVKMFDSSVTTGAGLTGLTSASSGLIISTIADNELAATAYTVAGSTIEAVTTIGTYAAPTATKCRFKVVDATNHPGVYEIQIADARFAVSSAKWLLVSWSGATNLAQGDMIVPLTVVDPNATNFGMSNVSSNVVQLLGTAWLTPGVAGTPDVNTKLAGGTAWGSGAITAGAIAANAIGASELATDASTAIATVLLNTINTGSTFNLANSVGKQIRQAAGNVPVSLRSGTAQTGSTANTIKLDSSASATNNIYNGAVVAVDGGTGIGQTRKIISYVGSTKVATVDRNWVTTPDNTSTFSLYASANGITSHEGTAQAGAAGTLTLASTASATTSIYNGSFLTILSGTNSGETRVITAYNGGTKVATVDSNWSVTPDNTSVYAVIPNGNLTADNVPLAPTVAEIWGQVMTELTAVPSANSGTVLQALIWLFEMAAHKRTQTATTELLKKADGTTTVGTSTKSDDGTTFSRGGFS